MRLNHFLVLFISIVLCGCSSKNEAPGSEEKTLTISTFKDPVSLDPRLVRTLPSVSIMHLFFDGLMRVDSQGKLQQSLAESFSISPDLKTYTFNIRKSQWSNGDPITAVDFEQTWKSVLDPAFPAPNAYQLFVIKGAKNAKEGTGSLHDIGIHAIDSSTLVVELESPVPYFLEMTSCHFYFPVCRLLWEKKEAAATPQQEVVISSGPFTLKSWQQRSELIAEKNPLYWNVQHVKLEHVKVLVLDDYTALKMFETGDLDWTGSPMSTIPQDSIAPMFAQGSLKTASGAGTQWIRYNTERFPFDYVKMRKALTLALDRQSIVDHVTQGKQLPADGILPPSFNLGSESYHRDHDLAQAKAFFKEALTEINIPIEGMPPISLCYDTNERNHKIAQTIQQQWKNVLGIDVQLERCENQVYYDRLAKGSFHMSISSWFADFRDPINFLEIFKSKNTPTNHTRWENPNYQKLLDASAQENDPKKRFLLLAEAEKILMDEMPVAPLFYSSFIHAKKEEISGVNFSELGYLDFRDCIKGEAK